MKANHTCGITGAYTITKRQNVQQHLHVHSWLHASIALFRVCDHFLRRVLSKSAVHLHQHKLLFSHLQLRSFVSANHGEGLDW